MICESVANSEKHRGEERRSDHRYPIRGTVEYRIVRNGEVTKAGIGLASDISDTGILFDAGQPLTSGVDLELLIPWPAAPNAAGRVELRAAARIVRSNENWCAARILHYGFQLRPRT